MLWSSKKSIKHFKNKQKDDFFLSERVMIDRVSTSITSVLDLGCASGKFIEILKCSVNKFKYTGLDIVQEQIDNAKSFYPEHSFICDDIKNIEYSNHFDLVNATGVFLHYPDYQHLAQLMVNASKKYILFDVKFAQLNDHLIDADQSYSEIDGHKLCYAIYNPLKFIRFLETVQSIDSIEIFGYPTSTNSLTVTPSSLGQIYSASVLLRKSKNVIETPVIHIEFQIGNKLYRDLSFL